MVTDQEIAAAKDERRRRGEKSFLKFCIWATIVVMSMFACSLNHLADYNFLDLEVSFDKENRSGNNQGRR